MKLIATIGANKLDKKHIYEIDTKEYEEYLSFMALSKAFKIEDIVLIGTSKSKESIEPLLKENPNIKMICIESDDVSKVFQESLNHIEKDTILDLTQGFRHYPMLTLLSSVFLQNTKDKNIKDIFYAQTIDNKCNPGKTSCRYKFVSLMMYLDIANMAKIINTFKNTLIVAKYEVSDKDFIKLTKNMENLSKALFSNNFQKSKELAKETKKSVKKLLKNQELIFLNEHLLMLKKELSTIENLTRYKESQTLLNVSEYFLKKDILLHSVTVLYESMVAFLDEKLSLPGCNSFKTKKGELKKTNTYQRRNCLKKKLSCKKQKSTIINCKKFKKILEEVDILRNISAHAFTSDRHEKDLEYELRKYIKELKPILSY